MKYFLIKYLFFAWVVFLNMSKVFANHWKYVALNNTWFNGNISTAMETGSLESKSLSKLCSTFCSLIRSCDGFYLEPSLKGFCHLVDEDFDPNLELTTLSNSGKIYYAKAPMDSNAQLFSPGSKGFRDCDSDTNTLPPSICSSTSFFPHEKLVVKKCSSPSQTTLGQTVNLIHDMKCPGEDRLIGCEVLAVEGENYNDTMRNALLGKSNIISQVYDFGNTILKSIKFTLKNSPVKLSRLIFRSTNYDGASKLKKVDIVIIGEKRQESMTVKMTSLEDCVSMVSFDYSGLSMTEKAEIIELRNMEWSGPFNGILKLDLFTRPQSKF